MSTFLPRNFITALLSKFSKTCSPEYRINPTQVKIECIYYTWNVQKYIKWKKSLSKIWHTIIKEKIFNSHWRKKKNHLQLMEIKEFQLYCILSRETYSFSASTVPSYLRYLNLGRMQIFAYIIFNFFEVVSQRTHL